MSHDFPGIGDAATWGAIRSPQDPRYDDRAEYAESKQMLDVIAAVREQLDIAELAAGAHDFSKANEAMREAMAMIEEVAE